ncbi:hypothetical protein VQ044_09435 [Aurantimonas sp. C2-5-R2]|uniref:hypothetical protein n=1 Tax=unclassified Aurantimonas TaxID=2638230 RepID=UPI002E1934B3|nr:MULTISPECIES: hypothetical protein [unclassified Aurantimonas]MEC5289979.1 hypothetical protein [Aurantimonas sp. C2-3-R2]MEC5411044.1 hypothetical protein [Aurantimonas sp. C2-4-R8]
MDFAQEELLFGQGIAQCAILLGEFFDRGALRGVDEGAGSRLCEIVGVAIPIQVKPKRHQCAARAGLQVEIIDQLLRAT